MSPNVCRSQRWLYSFFFIVEVARLTADFGMVAICAVVPAQYLLVTRSHLQFVTMIEDAECWKDNGIATFIRDGRCSCSIQRIKSEHNSSNFLFISSDCGESETAATPYEGWEFEASRIRSAIVAKTSRVPLLAAKIFLTIDGISCKKSDFKKGSATDCPAKALISLRSTVGQQSPSSISVNSFWTFLLSNSAKMFTSLSLMLSYGVSEDCWTMFEIWLTDSGFNAVRTWCNFVLWSRTWGRANWASSRGVVNSKKYPYTPVFLMKKYEKYEKI